MCACMYVCACMCVHNSVCVCVCHTHLFSQGPYSTACQVYPSDYDHYLRFKVLNIVRLHEPPPHVLRLSFPQGRSVEYACRRAAAPERSNEWDRLWGDLGVPFGAAGTERGAERDDTIFADL